MTNINVNDKNIVDPLDGCFTTGVLSPTIVSLPNNYSSLSLSRDKLDLEFPIQNLVEAPSGKKKTKKKPSCRFNKFTDTHEFEKVSSAFTVIIWDNPHLGYIPPKAKQVSEVMLHVPLLTERQMENILDETFINEKDHMLMEFAMVQVKYLKIIFSISGKLGLNDFNEKNKSIAYRTYFLCYFPGLVNENTGRIMVVHNKLFHQKQQVTGKKII